MWLLWSFAAFFAGAIFGAKAFGNFAATLLCGVVAGFFVGYVAMALTTPCAHCGSRWGFKWRHRRVDGGPDRRYNYNPQVCVTCGEPRD